MSFKNVKNLNLLFYYCTVSHRWVASCINIDYSALGTDSYSALKQFVLDFYDFIRKSKDGPIIFSRSHEKFQKLYNNSEEVSLKDIQANRLKSGKTYRFVMSVDIDTLEGENL